MTENDMRTTVAAHLTGSGLIEEFLTLRLRRLKGGLNEAEFNRMSELSQELDERLAPRTLPGVDQRLEALSPALGSEIRLNTTQL